MDARRTLEAGTAGVDVRSKETLLEVVDDASRRGTGVLIVSDELDDLRGCDRVLVMFQNVLTLGGVPAEWIDALDGAIILLALMISRVTSGRAQG